jgi:hypothetical protein
VVLQNTNGERKELHHFKNVSRIEVSSMSRADVGTYYCVANNGVGEPVNDSVVVHIRCQLFLILHRLFDRILTIIQLIVLSV